MRLDNLLIHGSFFCMDPSASREAMERSKFSNLGGIKWSIYSIGMAKSTSANIRYSPCARSIPFRTAFPFPAFSSWKTCSAPVFNKENLNRFLMGLNIFYKFFDAFRKPFFFIVCGNDQREKRFLLHSSDYIIFCLLWLALI